jgi:hypothetical protein
MPDRVDWVENAFKEEYLNVLQQKDETVASAELELAGPWRVERDGERFLLFREWEGLEHGDQPEATSQDVELVALLQLALPALARPQLLRLGEWEEPRGHQLLADGAPVAHMRRYAPEALAAVHVLASVIRSPKALATLLELAGPTGQEMTGQLLVRRVANAAAAGMDGTDTAVIAVVPGKP